MIGLTLETTFPDPIPQRGALGGTTSSEMDLGTLIEVALIFAVPRPPPPLSSFPTPPLFPRLVGVGCWTSFDIIGAVMDDFIGAVLETPTTSPRFGRWGDTCCWTSFEMISSRLERPPLLELLFGRSGIPDTWSDISAARNKRSAVDSSSSFSDSEVSDQCFFSVLSLFFKFFFRLPILTGSIVASDTVYQIIFQFFTKCTSVLCRRQHVFLSSLNMHQEKHTCTIHKNFKNKPRRMSVTKIRNRTEI